MDLIEKWGREGKRIVRGFGWWCSMVLGRGERVKEMQTEFIMFGIAC